MKVAKKPETNPGRPIDWEGQSYVEILRHEAASAAKNAQRIKDAKHAQEGSRRAWLTEFRNNR